MKIAYEDRRLSKVTLARVEQANQIVAEYQAQGFELTVRQIYYQFVARGLIENKLRSYKLVSNAIEKGRMTGLIDWNAVIDRTRETYHNSHWDDPGEILEACASSYALDSRADQDYYLEVWIEKNALLGVIEPVCKALDILYLPCIGYYSLSAMWRAAGRIRQRVMNHKQTAIILHLGDHDPSGLDMTRDIQDRMTTFGCEVKVKRIALNMDQVKKYHPPANFAKLTDTRADDYIRQFGEESWELDALSPKVIAKLIMLEVMQYTNEKKRKVLIKQQEEQRHQLEHLAENWETI